MSEPAPDVTALLKAWERGDAGARERLIPIVYDELRRVAARSLAFERDLPTLQPTALVHETYLKLVDQRSAKWQDRTHFFSVAARLMRRILVDRARERKAEKRGGGAPREAVSSALEVVAAPARDVELLALDEALADLAALDPRQAEVVELRYFGGLSLDETAAALGISAATVSREWSMARAWLFARLSG